MPCARLAGCGLGLALGSLVAWFHAARLAVLSVSLALAWDRVARAAEQDGPATPRATGLAGELGPTDLGARVAHRVHGGHCHGPDSLATTGVRRTLLGGLPL